MTKDEIKKALECCSNPSINFCKDCPYNNKGEFSCCDGEMCKDALNLITEQEQEIDRLKAENEELTKVVSSKVYDLINNTKEIADAREAWEKQAKIDVLNKLKDYVNQLACDEYGDSACDTNYITIDIDKYEQDIDEMIEEIKKRVYI